MRSSLRWLLGGSVALSALALWWPQDLTPVAVLPEASAQRKEVAAEVSRNDGAATLLPARLNSAPLEEAAADPFMGAQAPTAPAPPPPQPFVGPTYVPPPTPPTISYRYLGRMTDPSGTTLVYLSRADKEVAVSVGVRLDEGYTVEAITSEGVRLHYPPADARVTIPIPPASPDSTVR